MEAKNIGVGPERFRPSTRLSLLTLAYEIYFAPLTFYVRLQEVCHPLGQTRVGHLRHLFRTLVALVLQQSLYVLGAVFLQYALVELPGSDYEAGYAAAAFFALLMFVATSFSTVIWHFINNLRDFPKDKERHIYMALHRALIRGMILASAGFFLGLSYAILSKNSTDQILAPVIVNLVLCGVSVGVFLRLTLGIVHFEPMYLAGRLERFYLETWRRRRDVCRIVISTGAIVVGFALAYRQVGRVDLRIEEAFLSARLGVTAAFYFGLVVFVSGLFMYWGLSFPASWLRYTYLMCRYYMKKITAADALHKSPLVYDELFMVPVPWTEKLLLAVGRDETQDRAIEWLFFVLTRTYKVRAGSFALSSLIINGSVTPVHVLSYVRVRRQFLDVIPQVADYLPTSATQVLFSNLRENMDARNFKCLCAEITREGDTTQTLGGFAEILESLTLILEADEIDQLRKYKIPVGGGALAEINDGLEEIMYARDAVLRSNRRSGYQERARTFHRAQYYLRQANQKLGADPWFGRLLSKKIQDWIERLDARITRVLNAADLEIRVAPVALQIGLQELPVSVVNYGSGSALIRTVELQAEMPGSSMRRFEIDLEHENFLSGGSRRTFVLSVDFSNPGIYRCEIDLSFSDDLSEEKHLLRPLELIVRGHAEQFKDFNDPFLAGPPLRDSKLFKGRTSILKFFQEGSRPNLLVTGVRRIGKTSLLYKMNNCLGTRPSRMIDLQQFAPLKEERELAGAVAHSIDPDSRFDGKVSIGALQAILKEFLSLEGSPVILIDECEYLPEIDERLGGVLGAAMRHAINAYSCQVVVSGYLNIEKISGTILEQLYFMLQKRILGLLDLEDVEELFVEPLVGKLEVTPVVVDEFCALTGGHPYISQYLASAVVQEAKARRQVLIDETLMESAAEKTLRDLDELFSTMFWKDLSPEESKAILAVAFRRKLKKLPASGAISLRERCLIEGDSPESWKIPIGLFERWVWKNLERELRSYLEVEIEEGG